MSGRCSVCKKTFGITDLEDHIKIEHAPRGGRGIVSIKVKSDCKFPESKPKVKSGIDNKCDQCAHVSLSLRSLELHKMKVHASLVSCDECDKKFSKTENLKYHKMNTHTNEYKCTVCNFVARNMKFLNLHQAAKHTTIPLVKGMGMKRDASVRSKFPTKRAKLNLSAERKKEDNNDAFIIESSEEEEEFEESKPWSEAPWLNSEKEVVGVNIKGKNKKSFQNLIRKGSESNEEKAKNIQSQ